MEQIWKFLVLRPGHRAPAVFSHLGADALAQNQNEGGGTEYALNENFNRDFDQWLTTTTQDQRIADGGRFLIGTTSEKLQSAGVDNYQIYFGKGKIAQIMRNPEMTADVIKMVPQVVENPVIVMDSKTVSGAVTMFGDAETANGKPVMVSLLLHPETRTGEVLDYGVITSAYGRRTNNAQNLINSSSVRWVDPDTERTSEWSKALGLRLPSASTTADSKSSIPTSGQNVNGDSSQFGLVYDRYVQNAMDSGTANLINEAAKTFGLRVAVVDPSQMSHASANAEITGADILIRSGADKPILQLFGHELGHYLHDNAPEEYGRFELAVRQDLIQETADIWQLYDRLGQTLTLEKARQEAANNQMGRMMQDEGLLDRFIRQNREDKALLEKAGDAFRNLARKLTGADRRMAQTAQGKLLAALNAGMESGGTQTNTWYSLSEYDPETASIKEQIENSREQLNGMKVVAWETVPPTFKNKRAALLWAAERLKSTGYQVDRQNFGTIYFSSSDIRTAIEHSNTGAEQAAIAALPRVLKRGIEIGEHINHKGRGKQTVTIAAPVALNGTRGNMAVVVNRNGNRYYAHRIMLPDGSVFQFSDQNENAAPTTQRGVADNGSLANDIGTALDAENGSTQGVTENGSLAGPQNSASTNIIPDSSEKSNTKYSLSEEGQKALDYFGRTYLWEETGWLLPNGVKLDFSGRHEGAPGGYRIVDHRDIRDALGEDYGGDSYSGALVQFMNDGNIRISPESNGINLSVQPTASQERALDDFISRSRGEVTLDIDNMNGDTIASQEYTRGTRSAKVLENIRQYFESGKIPSMSATQQFHTSYSLSEDSARRARETNQELLDGMLDDLESTANTFATDRKAGESKKQRGNWSDNQRPQTELERRLARENAQLRKQEARLQRELTRTTEAVPQPNKLRAEVKAVLDGYSSQYNNTQLYGDLKDLYTYMANGQAVWHNHTVELTFETTKEWAMEIAGKVLRESTVRTDMEEYQALRETLKGSTITVADDVKADLNMPYRDFVKEYGKEIHFGKNGVGIDVVWQELEQRYPALFDGGKYLTQADMLNHLGEVLDATRSTDTAPFTEGTREFKLEQELLANDLIKRFYTIPQQAPTFADKQARKLTQTKIDAQNRLGQMKEHYEERLARERERGQERVERTAEQAREQYRERENAARERRIESENRTRLLKVARRLQNRKMMPGNRAVIDELIGDLDTVAVSMTGETLTRLEGLDAWYSYKKANDPDFISDPRIENNLARLSKRQISDLSLLDVRDLTDALLNIENELRTEKHLLDSQEKRDIYKLGEVLIQDVNGSRGSRGGPLDRFIITETLSPERQMRRMAGYVDGSPLIRLTESLSEGQRKMLDYQMRAEQPAQRFANDKQFNRNFSGAKAQEIEM